jgi:hypothetical protein
MAVDIEGNARFYDLIRLKKIAKLSSSNTRDADARFHQIGAARCKWRLTPNITMEIAQESFLGVT